MQDTENVRRSNKTYGQSQIGGTTVYSVKRGPVAALLLLAACVAVAQTNEPEPRQTYDPIVLVVTETLHGPQIGQGFVVGDGTVVVTAYHVAHDTSRAGELPPFHKGGDHRMAGVVSVISPYLGAACEAEIVGADPELDFAVLRIPWMGHPSFALADDSSVRCAESVVIVGMIDCIRALASPPDALAVEWRGMQSQNLPIDFVGVRSDVPRFMLTAEVGELGPGWSGCPMLLSGTSLVAGCFSAVVGPWGGRAVEFDAAKGSAVAQVRGLLHRLGEAEPLAVSPRLLPRPADAGPVWLLWLQVVRNCRKEQLQEVIAKAQALIRLRPQCAFAYRRGAKAAEVLGRYDVADASYQQALRVVRENAGIRAFYADYLLKRGEEDRALEELETVWQSGKHRPWAAVLMFGILADRGEYTRCSQMLNEALAEEPNNAYLHAQLGGTYRRQGDYASAVTHYTRAVELLPENDDFREVLNKAQEKAGNLDIEPPH